MLTSLIQSEEKMCFHTLSQVNSELNTKENRALIHQNANHAFAIKVGIHKLSEINKRTGKNLATQKNFDFIMQCPAAANDLAAGLCMLMEPEPPLDTELNRTLLLRHFNHISNIHALHTLFWYHKLSLTQQNFDQFIRYRDFLPNIIENILRLNIHSANTQQPFDCQQSFDNEIASINKQVNEERFAFLRGAYLPSFQLSGHIFDFLPAPRLKHSEMSNVAAKNKSLTR
jgi:hypothetical protein